MNNRDDTQEMHYMDVSTSMRSPRRKPKRKKRGMVNTNLQPVVILAALGALAIVGLIVLQFAPGHSATVETTLASAVVAAVAAIAGIVRGSGDGN